MYRVKVEGYFSSAHNLRAYKGKCETLHGHNWKVEVTVAGKALDKTGMVMDFTVLKAHLAKVTEDLDHRYLNSIAYFKKANPTSEYIARYIYGRLKPRIRGIESVTVWESQNSSATYQRV
ncbi:MAG TPA: 6-carboxytetrahydropterin synthase QueD [Patescibacteria group bacterium]|nr:6-carboxytetrahydropterin synthase QueD [Patescibacteria group bacterium]